MSESNSQPSFSIGDQPDFDSRMDQHDLDSRMDQPDLDSRMDQHDLDSRMDQHDLDSRMDQRGDLDSRISSLLSAGDVQHEERTSGMPFVAPNGEVVMYLRAHPDFHPQGSAPASLEQINALRTSLVGQEQLDSSCNICLEAFQLNEEIKHLPCKHFLHSECLNTWLAKDGRCPNCRTSCKSGQSLTV